MRILVEVLSPRNVEVWGSVSITVKDPMQGNWMCQLYQECTGEGRVLEIELSFFFKQGQKYKFFEEIKLVWVNG